MFRRYGKGMYRKAFRKAFRKFSVENIMVSGTMAHTGTGWEWPVDGGNPIGYYVVNPATFTIDAVSHTIMGTRKAKNFSLTFLCDVDRPVLWALVFKPEGVDVKNLTPGNGTIYEPNQNVIMTGIYTPGQQSKWSTRLGRNLNSGDSIILLVAGYSADATTFQWGAQISYAISF